MGGKQQLPRLGLGLVRKRQVDGHLVAVEIGVIGGAHERVEPDGAALDAHRLEGLDAEPVQRRRAVQQYRLFEHRFLERVPDHRVVAPGAFHHAFGGMGACGDVAIDEPADKERLEELQAHGGRQAALVELEIRVTHDDRTRRVIHAFAQQVLAETPTLPRNHIRQALERPVARPHHRSSTAGVVEQRVAGVLQQALLVVEDDLRRFERDELLDALIPADDALVERVQIICREVPIFQLHQGTQRRRQHRDHGEDHPAGVGA